MALQISVKDDVPQAHCVTVALQGSLDTATATLFDEQMTDIAARIEAAVVLDLAELEFLSSAGIRSLLLLRKSIQICGGSVAMINMQPQIQKVFDIVKALPGFKVFSNQAEMDRYLASLQRKVKDSLS